jgi:TrmH family RNA methyltransferase
MEKANKRQLKNIRRLLKEKKMRDFENCFIAEGDKIVMDIVSKGHGLDSLFVSNGYTKKEKSSKVISNLEKKDIPVYNIADAEFDRISSLRNSQGILAVVKRDNLPKFSHLKKNVFAVLCDGVQDPGNLGTIIRTSVAMGVDSVLLSGECADPFNPKVVRSSSGTIADISVSKCNISNLEDFKKQGFKVLAAQAARKGAKDISKISKIPARCIVVFGSEGRGISKEMLKKIDQFFFIPISGKIESLNVTSAVAMSLYALKCAIKGG